MEKAIKQLFLTLQKADSLFIDYLQREALPIKNWRGLPAPITEDLQDKLKGCVGTHSNSISYAIKDAMQSNNIFMNKKGTGLEEMSLVSDRYKAALFKMTAMTHEPACEYSVLGGKFRMVKLVGSAKQIYEELVKVSASLPKGTGDDVANVIAEVIATEQAKHVAAGVGSANHRRRGGGKTRRHRKRGTRRR